jgi:hypothetical protein
MSRNIDRKEGGGPWQFRPESEGIDPLPAGESVRFDFERMTYNGQKRYFRDWLPMDQVLLKNLDDSNGVTVTYNHRFSAFVEPNAADTFDQVGVRHVEIRNDGGTAIASDDLRLQTLVTPYGADDQAREQAGRHPLKKILWGTLNL